ncbi:MAG: hypothetical protein ACREIF_18275 [Chthoniobacterales bacterium]
MERTTLIEFALRAVAGAQLGIALLNFSLVRLMRWKPDLDQLPLLIREVFQVHLVFISVTVATFAVLTWRFAREIATAADPAPTWLAIAIGIFWSIRSIMQWTSYSSTHWRGDTIRTGLHWLLFLGYGAFAVVYLMAGFSRT